MKVSLFLKRQYKYILIIACNIAIYLTIFYLLYNSKLIVKNISNIIELFVYTLIPSLFPFLLITDYLIASGKIQGLTFGMSKALSKLFGIPSFTTPAIVMGFLFGYPNSAKYISALYRQGKITSITATKLISFTTNANISFIISSVGLLMFNSIEIGLTLTISHYLSAIILGIILRDTTHTDIIQQNITNSNTFNKIYSPFETLTSSLQETFKTLSVIFGFMVCFNIPALIITNTLNLPTPINEFIVGLFEISCGLKALSNLNLSLNLILPLASFILSFSSLMIIFEVFAFAKVAKIKFTNLLFFKFIQGILSSIITHVIFVVLPIDATFVFKNLDVTSVNSSLLPSTIYIAISTITLIIILHMAREKRQE